MKSPMDTSTGNRLDPDAAGVQSVDIDCTKSEATGTVVTSEAIHTVGASTIQISERET